jgi:hypothetical protein
MDFGTTLMIAYRLLALAVAALLIIVLFRVRDWRQQLFAAIVLVPFALRAAGLK